MYVCAFLILQSCYVDVFQVPSVEEVADVTSGENLYVPLPITKDENLPPIFGEFINVCITLHCQGCQPTRR